MGASMPSLHNGGESAGSLYGEEKRGIQRRSAPASAETGHRREGSPRSSSPSRGRECHQFDKPHVVRWSKKDGLARNYKHVKGKFRKGNHTNSAVSATTWPRIRHGWYTQSNSADARRSTALPWRSITTGTGTRARPRGDHDWSRPRRWRSHGQRR